MRVTNFTGCVCNVLTLLQGVKKPLVDIPPPSLPPPPPRGLQFQPSLFSYNNYTNSFFTSRLRGVPLQRIM